MSGPIRGRAFQGQGEMRTLLRAFPWAGSPLGPLDRWPQSLRATVQTLLASRYPMILAWGSDLTQIYNDAYAELIGDKHPAALGTDLRVTLAEAWDTLGPMIERVMATGEASWTPALLLPLERSGYREESYFSVSHAPVEDDEGRIAGMLAVCSEVTQQVLGERRLRLLRDLASRAGETREVESACRHIAAALGEHPLDVPFACIYLRNAGRLELGCSAGEACDAPWLAAAVTRAEAGEEALAERGRKEAEADAGGPVGGPWNEPVRAALALPIASASPGAPLGVLVAGVSPSRALDESYRSFYQLLAGQVSVALRNARAREDERRHAEMLQELDRAKTAFFGNVSHELRTPLTLLLGPLEDLLARGPLPAEVREPLAMAHRNALRLLRLVNTLLDISRVEAGRLAARFQPTDLAAWTAELAGGFRTVCERAGLALTVHCPPLPEPVHVDPDLWEKIVLNLLSNAYKFTSQGGIEVELRAAPGAGGPGAAVLTVRDTGTGIPAAELPRLFERFHRVQGARGRTHEGTGIGLALVRELAELHGGAVRVESQVGRGSTFEVTVPFGTVHLPAAATGGEDAETPAPDGVKAARPYVEEALRWTDPPAPADPEASPPGSSGTARILVVDDNADLRDYLRRQLQSSYEVEEAADGAAALAAARRQPPDLVLSDVMMPGLDGFALLRELRADPLLRTVPVILLSARAGEEARLAGLETGADDYLVKPFSARELRARLRIHLELARMRREAERQAARAKALQEERRRRDEFLALLSHELRNPLAPLRNALELLETPGVGAAAAARARQVMARQVEHFARLLDDLLEVAQVVQGTVELRRERLDLGRMVRQVPAGEAHPEVELDVAGPATPVWVQGDPERLERVLDNLIGNALRFTPAGGRVSVELTVDEPAHQAVLTVRDSGVGIDPEVLPHVFEAFAQADRSLDRTAGGLGLGLTLVRGLVELHGGTVEAASEGPGQGATFTVRLPQVA